ncbi:MAG: hypothetical protein OSB09_09970 [Planctomycetota bacterium]|nr:hypothetical protein [Planctomycetota bacterium]
MNLNKPASTSNSASSDRWVTFLAIVLPAVIAFHPLANNDLPMHLAIGDWIIEQGEIPRTDPFSANGQGGRWIAHEWLAALIFATSFKVGGANGLVALAVALAALLGWLQDKIARLLEVPAVARILWLVPLWLVAGRRLMLRPHLLGLCSVLALFCVTLIGRERPRCLWLAVPLMALWANIHSSFILGIAFLIFDLLIWPDGHRARRSQRIAILASTIGATFFQPHGIGLFLFPFQLGLDPVFTQEVMEWVSPFADSSGGTLFRTTASFWIGVPLFGLTLIAVVRQRFTAIDGQAPRAVRLATVVAITMALLQQRHFALAALLSSLMLGIWITPLCLRWPEPMRRLRLRAAVPITAVLLMLLAYGYPATITGPEIQWRKIGSGWSKRLPILPVSILADEWQVSGDVLCEYEYGSVVVHASAGRLKPTMDSRNTVYGAQRFKAHNAALSGRNLAEQDRLLAQVCAVLIRAPEQDESRRRLTQRLENDTEWQLIHIDQNCRMWLKKQAAPSLRQNR